MRSRRKIRVRNGIEVSRVMSRMVGERARRNGFARRRRVVRVSVDEVVWMSLGRLRRRRAVRRERTNGIKEKRRSLEDRTQVSFSDKVSRAYAVKI
jgi:hypothetical protein